jgi:hypothetical protein
MESGFSDALNQSQTSDSIHPKHLSQETPPLLLLSPPESFRRTAMWQGPRLRTSGPPPPAAAL